MVKISGTFEKQFYISLPINDFEEIMTHNMTIQESDELIKQQILKEYGIEPDEIIRVDGELK